MPVEFDEEKFLEDERLWRELCKKEALPNCPSCNGDGYIELSCGRGEARCRCNDVAKLEADKAALIETLELFEEERVKCERGNQRGNCDFCPAKAGGCSRYKAYETLKRMEKK